MPCHFAISGGRQRSSALRSCCTPDFQHAKKLISDLQRNIVAVFTKNSVQIMTPSYEADPEVPKIPNEKWDDKLAGLG